MRSAALFCVLFFVIAVLGSIENISLLWTGFFLFALAVFALFRFAWMAEFIFWQKGSELHGLHSLPARLLKKLSYDLYDKDGYLAARVLGSSVIFWLLLAGLYFFWVCFVSFFPQEPASFVQAQETIRSYFFHVLEKDFEGNNAYLFLQNIVFFFSAGLIYLSALSFANRPSHSRIIGYVCLLTFAAAVFVNFANLEFVHADFRHFYGSLWAGYSFERIPVMQALDVIPAGKLTVLQMRYYALGLGGVILFYMLGSFMTLQFFMALFRGASQAAYAVLGLGIMAVLLMMDVLAEVSLSLNALWFSAAGILAILHERSYNTARKIYRLRQG